MSQAEDLLNSIDEENISTRTTDPLTEEHIVIGPDRFIIVPEPLKRIAVQYDHDVETVTFDCPRYWDNHDLSTMYIYINYIRNDAVKGAYLAKNVVIDEVDENVIHFEWTISQEITVIEGKINFLVCAIRTDEEGFQEIHWNSEINSEMFVSKGLEASEVILEKYPDIINDLLTRMDQILIGDGTVIDTTLTLPGIAAEAAVVGQRFEETNNRIDETNKNLQELDDITLKEEVDPTVPDWAKQPEKPTYSHDELTDGDTLAVKDTTLQTGLNAEMVGGKKLIDIALIDHYELIGKYNVPTLTKLWDNYNYLALDHKISQYEVGMRVLIELQHQYTNFTSSILPALTAASTDDEINAVKGFYSEHYEAFDKSTSTYFKGYMPLTKIICPVPIKPTKITYRAGGGASGFDIRGTENTSLNNSSGTTLASGSLKSTVTTYTLNVTDSNYYTVFLGYGTTTGVQISVYEMDITAGSVSMFNKALPSYININGLGNKLIYGSMEAGNKYELVYNGTGFDARKVA